MHIPGDCGHHCERVRAELDLAARAANRAAAEAHLRLSALHIGRVAALSRTASRSAGSGIGSEALRAALLYAPEPGSAQPPTTP